MANTPERFGIRMPHASTNETLVGRDVKVQPRRVDVFADFMPELDTDVRLVGRFVGGEPGVPVDPHQRPAYSLVNRHQMGREPFQRRSKVANQL
jgi:hypothetical protein